LCVRSRRDKVEIAFDKFERVGDFVFRDYVAENVASVEEIRKRKGDERNERERYKKEKRKERKGKERKGKERIGEVPFEKILDRSAPDLCIFMDTMYF